MVYKDEIEKVRERLSKHLAYTPILSEVELAAIAHMLNVQFLRGRRQK